MSSSIAEVKGSMLKSDLLPNELSMHLATVMHVNTIFDPADALSVSRLLQLAYTALSFFKNKCWAYWKTSGPF